VTGQDDLGPHMMGQVVDHIARRKWELISWPSAPKIEPFEFLKVMLIVLQLVDPPERGCGC